MIYALSIKGSIEEYIFNALRKKKEVQASLMQDAQRDGYASFVENLIEGMQTAIDESDDGYFDAEEMNARIQCGVPPFSKLSDKLITRKLQNKLRLRTQKAVAEYIAHCPETNDTDVYNERYELRQAYHLLMGRIK